MMQKEYAMQFDHGGNEGKCSPNWKLFSFFFVIWRSCRNHSLLPSGRLSSNKSLLSTSFPLHSFFLHEQQKPRKQIPLLTIRSRIIVLYFRSLLPTPSLLNPRSVFLLTIAFFYSTRVPFSCQKSIKDHSHHPNHHIGDGCTKKRKNKTTVFREDNS